MAAEGQLGARVASETDVEAVVAIMAAAFVADPLWGPVFSVPRPPHDQAAALWRVFVSSAARRYPWTFIAERQAAATVWLPPGATELTGEEQAGLDDYLVEALGSKGADAALAIGKVFETALPDEPHFYLSLFGTHAEHRGTGIGMRLLRENLARIDATGAPAYLESSNPANDERYRSVGFEPRAELVMPAGQRVTTMWRTGR